eukprot:353835-Chlamydomonas_euryale.AAC.3
MAGRRRGRCALPSFCPFSVTAPVAVALQIPPLSRPGRNSAALPVYLWLGSSAQPRDPGNATRLHRHSHASPMPSLFYSFALLRPPRTRVSPPHTRFPSAHISAPHTFPLHTHFPSTRVSPPHTFPRSQVHGRHRGRGAPRRHRRHCGADWRGTLRVWALGREDGGQRVAPQLDEPAAAARQAQGACVCACVRACACVRTCVRACVRACVLACVRAC